MNDYSVDKRQRIYQKTEYMRFGRSLNRWHDMSCHRSPIH